MMISKSNGDTIMKSSESDNIKNLSEKLETDNPDFDIEIVPGGVIRIPETVSIESGDRCTISFNR